MKNLKYSLRILAGLFLIINTAQAQNTSWKLDKSHSSIGFSINHLSISETTGQFNDYKVDIAADKGDFTDAKFSLTIQTKSIDTKNAARDKHLRGKDFFHVEKYPTIVFKGKEFKKVTPYKYQVIGILTLNGVSKEVSFEARFGGIVKDPWGGIRTGIKLWGVIDRYAYGLKYNSILDSGGLAIGREVNINCRLELIKDKK